MRRLVWVAVALVASVAACDTHTGPSRSNGITVYEHPDFGGSSRTIDGNIWDLDDIRGPCFGFFDEDDIGDWDNCISSVQLPSGWEAILYEHDHYEGETLTVTASIADLHDVNGPCGDDWNDCVSSIRVQTPR